jgi:hypothetical protein
VATNKSGKSGTERHGVARSRSSASGKKAPPPKKKAGAETVGQASTAPPVSASRRLLLIRARHEMMKREMAQIQEDLESEED